ncbi:MBOAT family protein [Paenibacillus sp. SC116]|uniref:MBOAT family O-acyltransferase n=1 Tax=Paenibacillus sp. SC116 TaxID=2968986 RepID=UPI00215AEB9D|nr:MBOAT family O-acyltransferase [Paenibacillus sp. SC116]MCR8842354.1 MBOAT family protein [Paenibacillus sp. SC116]
MVFSSIVFLFLFLPGVLTIYYGLLRGRQARNIFLLLASLVFYAWGEPVYVLLMIASFMGNYVFGLWVHAYREQKQVSHIVITVMLIYNLGILGVFKYLGFAIGIINNMFQMDLAVPHLTLPIGISFYTFQGISYVIDIYRRDAEPLTNPLDVGLYIALFMQLVAGPIVRFKTVAKQIYGRCENESDFVKGIGRFIEGLAVKVLLANNFALLADTAFSLEGYRLSVMLAWMGAVAYGLQIFFDFSGYSAMAIGLANMFGFHFEENFNVPYISRTISEFWRRWHISLGTWFRDNVYIPLGGSRVSKWKVVRNLFVVWFLTGLWHGANWTFLVWGLYFFFFIMLEKIFGLEGYFAKYRALGHLYVIVVVLFGWVLFRANSITHAFEYIQSMLGMNGNAAVGDEAIFYFREYVILFMIGIISCLPLKKWVLERHMNWMGPAVSYTYPVVMAVLLLFSIAYLVKGSYNPFIYFNF